MTTRLELRTAVRRRLEDVSGSPLWDDATLNDFLEEAMRRYGTRFPVERSTTVALSAGALSAVVSPELSAEQIVRVCDGEGNSVPRLHGTDDGAASTSVGLASAQAWRWWGSSMILARGATAGTWQIDYRGGRTLPGNDVSAVEIIAGDEDIVVLLAAAMALQRRAIEDGKRGLGRGGSSPIASAAAAFERQADGLMRARRRQVRGGWTASG